MAEKRLQVTFFGGTGEVTGSNFLVETLDEQHNVRVLIDCGLFQGSKVGEAKNREPFPFEPASVDYLFVTHAHIDHTGRIPKLVKDGFEGKIISTLPTHDLAEVMLLDSMGVLTKEAEQEGQMPLYNENDVTKAMTFWKGVEYHEEVAVGTLRFRFLDAGHTLGSSMIEISYGAKKIVFTGDLGNSPAPLLRSAEVLKDVNFLVMESVYGDRNHEHRDERKQLLEDVIEETMKKQGVLMIPAFSLERTQELLYEIEGMMEQERIPLVPVFVDSPLAIKVTDIYKKYERYFNREVDVGVKGGNEIFQFPQLHFTMTTEESKGIKEFLPPKIIMAGSGMSNGGRILHHEKLYLPDPNSTLLLAGYQSAGTLGRRLQDGEKLVKIHGEYVQVAARVAQIHGYSGHMDSEHLLEFAATSVDSLEHVFVTMGEPKSALFLTQRLRDYLGIDATVPTAGEQAIINC